MKSVRSPTLAALKQKIKNIQWAPGVKLLNFDANGLISIDKPAGMLAHPNSPKDISRSMITSPYCLDQEMFTCKGADGRHQNVWLLNRLDSATSGVLLLSVCPDVAASVKDRFVQHQVDKCYRAIVFGTYKGRGVGVWRHKIATSKNERGQLRSVVDEYSGLPTESRVALVKHMPGYGTPLSVLELAPVTGRTHQLRLHSAAHGHPIVGDSTYGDFSLNQMTKYFPNFEDRLYLHAHRVSLGYSLSGRAYSFSSESRLSTPFS